MRAGQLTAFLLAVALGPLASGAVRAEPYFMVRQGAKCADCHVNQTGGGMRTAFANIHAKDILHDYDLLPLPAGIKAFRGEITPYVSIGADLRVRNTTLFQSAPDAAGNVPTNEAFRNRTVSNTTELFEFPVYLKVDLWPDVLSLYVDENFEGGATNREAIGIIRGFAPWDTYVKFGRFFPTFGLRVWDDDSFIRSQTGYTFQNPDEGGEIGFGPGPFFLATSITNGAGGDKDVAATVNGYGVFQDVPFVRNVLLGASYARQSNKKWTAGWYAGASPWLFTFLGEFDLIDDRSLNPPPAGRPQYASYAEARLLLLDWLDVFGNFDFVKIGNARSQVRYVIGLDPFFSRFLQTRLYYDIRNGPRDDVEANADRLIFEVHLFF